MTTMLCPKCGNDRWLAYRSVSAKGKKVTLGSVWRCDECGHEVPFDVEEHEPDRA